MKQQKNSRPVKRRIGVALGGGGARGWAHIGVLRALDDYGIRPDIVCGTSIGSLVGAAYVTGQMDQLESWIRQLKWQEVVSLLDFRFSGGLIEGEKLFNFFSKKVQDHSIDELPHAYAAVATSLHNGQEIWLRHGSILDAVRASIALPGLFSPWPNEDVWLVDGGLVNPVPVSVCRALGADIVIASALATPQVGHHSTRDEVDREEHSGFAAKLKNLFDDDEDDDKPSLLDVVTDSIDIMQLRIMRSRMAGDPPDIMIRPKTANIGLLEFYRGTEAIDAGRAAAEKAKEDLAPCISRT